MKNKANQNQLIGKVKSAKAISRKCLSGPKEVFFVDLWRRIVRLMTRKRQYCSASFMSRNWLF
jgi:hypothetical protein